MTFIEHPTFQPGQKVKYGFGYDGTAKVIADNGDFVRIEYQRPRKPSLKGDESESLDTYESDSQRGQLGSMQFQKRTAKMLTWMCRPTSVIGGKADMARACHFVR
jgi:hypothetical protein